MIAVLIVASAAMTTALAQVQTSDSQAARREALSEARYLRSIYKTDAAIECLSGLLSPGVFDEELLAEMAECHFLGGDYDAAYGTYQMLSLRFPDNILYKIKVMQLAYRLKDYGASVAAGKAILQQDSIPAVAAFTGDAYNLAGLTDSALVCYRQALSLKPMNESVVSKAAKLLLDEKDYDGVIAMTGDYLALDPENITVLPIRGLAWYLSARYDSSTVVFEKLEKLGQDSYPVHFYLGQSYWHDNVQYMAERELVRAWALDSSDANLAYTIAAVKTEMYRSFDDDIKLWLDRAEDMVRPDSSFVSRIHQQYATGCYRLDRFDQAIKHYREAYRYNPSFIQAIYTIGYCYERQKKYKQALEYYEKYLKLVKPGSKSYEMTLKGIEYVKGQLFMEED